MFNHPPLLLRLGRLSLLFVLVCAGAFFFTALAQAGQPAPEAVRSYAQSRAACDYQILVVPGASGTITPGTGFYACGSTVVFTITPDMCYTITDVRVDGVSVGAVSQYTFTNLSATHFITAAFAVRTFTLFPVAGVGGHFVPNSPQSVPCGGSQAFDVVEFAGYHAAGIYVDGVLQPPPWISYTFANVTASHVISVAFALNTYTITSAASMGGSIYPVGMQTYTHGSSQEYQVIADSYYYIGGVWVDGVAQPVPGFSTSFIYPFSSITANHTLTATFAPITYSIFSTASPVGWGTITPNGSQIVPRGGSIAFTLTPAACRVLESVYVDGFPVIPAPSVYTFTNVTDNHVITATFAPRGSRITPIVMGNGTILPSDPITAYYGESYPFTITPNTGNYLAYLAVTGVPITPVSVYTFTSVCANQTLFADFATLDYIITTTAGPNGTISPLGVSTYTPGSDAAFTLTPAVDHHIENLWVDGSLLPFNQINTHYTFTNLLTHHTLSATFGLDPTTLTVTVVNSSTQAQGRVRLFPGNLTCTGICSYGFSDSPTVVISATAINGVFLGWGGACSGPGITCTLAMVATRTVTAYFATPLTVTLRVLSGTQPISNALIYRLPMGQTANAVPLGPPGGPPFRTDAQGYLQGAPTLYGSDRLVALAPISATSAYTLYYTSAPPNATSLDFYTVAANGVHTLAVSAANPLLVFPLTVSLEWDARQDSTWLGALTTRLEQASALLYDATDGQVALGPITLYHAKAHWEDADVRVAATNALHPNAHQGGIVRSVTPDPDVPTLLYDPGAVRIGAAWLSSGASAPPGLGTDWYQALAHELGHFLLFLDDDYFTVDAAGHILPITNIVPCTNTLMTNAYADTELRRPNNWAPDCLNTPAQYFTGRSDWATVQRFYPMLNLPSAENPGPTVLPLTLLTLTAISPLTPTTVFTDINFYVRDQGLPYALRPTARAFLQRARQLVELGRLLPGANGTTLIPALGAQPGDKLCVYDLRMGEAETTTSYGGCKTLSLNDNHLLTVTALSAWKPDVRLKLAEPPTQLQVQVDNLEMGQNLTATLFYEDFGVLTQPLTYTGSLYQTTFVVPSGTVEGKVLVWVGNDSNPDARRAALVAYGLSGHPSNKRRTGRAPLALGSGLMGVSPDGQVRLYTTAPFAAGAFLNLYAATYVPAGAGLPTLIKHSYWVSSSTTAPDILSGTLVFNYVASDMHTVDLSTLRVYYLPNSNLTHPTQVSWVSLPTTINAEEGLIFGTLNGPGLYVVAAAPICNNCASQRLWLPLIRK